MDARELPAVIATRLHAPSPNPAMGSTTLRLDLARAIDARLAIFDPSGRCAATLRQGAFAPGQYVLTWDGRSENGARVGAGTYFVRLSAPGLRTQTSRLVIVR
jgi:hypothetical protein